MSHAGDSLRVEPGREECFWPQQQEPDRPEELQDWLSGSPQRHSPGKMPGWQLGRAGAPTPVHRTCGCASAHKLNAAISLVGWTKIVTSFFFEPHA